MPTSVRESIAGRVRAELERQGRTQRQVADLLGIDQGSVSLRLTGRRPFRAEELLVLAVALDVPLTTFADPPPTPPKPPPVQPPVKPPAPVQPQKPQHKPGDRPPTKPPRRDKATAGRGPEQADEAGAAA